VLAQTYSDVEHVLVDDASTDGTRAILDDYARRNGERVRVVAFDERAGPTRRRNDALAAARGRYIGWLDHDDLWLPRKLELQVAVLEERQQVGFVYGQYERFDDATGEVLERSHIDGSGDLLRRLYVEGCFIASSTVLFRAEALARRGGQLRERDFSFGDDHFLWLTLALDWEGVLVDEVVTRLRVHEAQETQRLGRSNSYLWSIELLRELVATYPDAAAKLGRDRRRGIAHHYGYAAAYELQRGRRRAAARYALAGASRTPLEAGGYAARRLRNRLRRFQSER